MTTSRAIGVVGIANTLAQAEKIAEDAVTAVSGPVSHRPDIGTAALIEKRVQHMEQIRNK
jgi:phosphoribosylamine--glycine ligase